MSTSRSCCDARSRIARKIAEAYPRGVARASPTRGFLPIAAAGLVLTWVIGAGAYPAPFQAASTPTHGAAIDPIAELLTAESNHPTVSRHTRAERVGRGVWIAPPTSLAVNLLLPSRGFLIGPPTLSPGRIAQGRTGRGPPFFRVL
jgi:hypothetical protein